MAADYPNQLLARQRRAEGGQTPVFSIAWHRRAD
jgi:hypothetical protein